MRCKRVDRVHPLIASMQLVRGLPVGVKLVPPRLQDPLPEEVEVCVTLPTLLFGHSAQDGDREDREVVERRGRGQQRQLRQRGNVAVLLQAKPLELNVGAGKVMDCYLRARCGDAESQFMVGFMHTEGRGLELDKEAATAWFELAHAQGFAEATVMLNASLLLVELV